MKFERVRRLVIAYFLGSVLLQGHVVAQEKDEPFRPQPGQFPPLEMAHSFQGELTFVDHANRRGSVRVAGEGTYFRNAPHPFAMLPYGVLRYHDAPADLRDIPLGTVLHFRSFLPPDPKFSSVPVLPVNNRNKTAGYSGVGIAPAENHAILVEDEPSYCRRLGLVWRIKDVEVKSDGGLLTAQRITKASNEESGQFDTLTYDSATRFWKGREKLSVRDVVADGLWPESGKQEMNNLTVLLGLTWKPTPSGVFTRFHVSDVWLDDTAMERAAATQTETHKAFIRSRWMPAWIDQVEYEKFGNAIVTVTLFGGMDPSLYAAFRKGNSAMINASENTLKHAGGNYGPSHMASRGNILDVIKAAGEIPLGSSGIQLKFKTDLIIEGIRPGRVVRVYPGGWPMVNLPREEFLGGGSGLFELRFPSPAIFPNYK